MRDRESDTDVWLVHIDGVPRCQTYGRSLRQASARIREALAVWLDCEPEALTISDRLPEELEAMAQGVARRRVQAERAEAAAQEAIAEAVRELAGKGLSRRDAADLLGISHQRVQQFLARCFAAQTQRAIREGFDEGYQRWRGSQLHAELFGEGLPPAVQPFSFVPMVGLRELAALLGVTRGRTLVDLGCGRGGPGVWLAARSGARLIGVDGSAVAIDDARNRRGLFGDPALAGFRVGDATATDLPTGCAEAVVTIDVLQLVRDPAAVLREGSRLLRPGGRLVRRPGRDTVTPLSASLATSVPSSKRPGCA